MVQVGTPLSRHRQKSFGQTLSNSRQRSICIGAAVMVMAEWLVAICFLIRIGVRSVGGRDMDMCVVVIRVGISQGDSRPVGRMTDRMLRLHHAVQVERHQKGDAQPYAKVADEVGQESGLLLVLVAFSTALGKVTGGEITPASPRF